MARCKYCGSETQLYDNGVPVCIKCLDEEAERRKSQNPASQKPGEPVPPKLTDQKSC